MAPAAVQSADMFGRVVGWALNQPLTALELFIVIGWHVDRAFRSAHGRTERLPRRRTLLTAGSQVASRPPLVPSRLPASGRDRTAK